MKHFGNASIKEPKVQIKRFKTTFEAFLSEKNKLFFLKVRKQKKPAGSCDPAGLVSIVNQRV